MIKFTTNKKKKYDSNTKQEAAKLKNAHVALACAPASKLRFHQSKEEFLCTGFLDSKELQTLGEIGKCSNGMARGLLTYINDNSAQ